MWGRIQSVFIPLLCSPPSHRWAISVSQPLTNSGVMLKSSMSCFLKSRSSAWHSGATSDPMCIAFSRHKMIMDNLPRNIEKRSAEYDVSRSECTVGWNFVKLTHKIDEQKDLFPMSSGVSERESERSEQCGASEWVIGASEWANGDENGPVVNIAVW